LTADAPGTATVPAADDSAPAATPLLRVNEIDTYYGNIRALKGLSLEVFDGEIVTLLGANGAGKSTTLRTISGTVKPRLGTVELDGMEIQQLPAHEVVKQGISQSPEGRRVFARMTVLENLQLGSFIQDGKTFDEDLQRVFDLFPRLLERKTQKAGTLSGGEQQMLAIGRALMARPRLLLLDEPSMGLAPILVQQIFQIIRDINAQGTTIMLVEQNALMALGVASRGYILQSGRIVLHDQADKLAQNEEVKRAYLGG
jgi:branched-chain amino acid transport system ATP-binding protein